MPEQKAGMGQKEATSAKTVYSRDKISYGGISLTQERHTIPYLNPPGRHPAKTGSTPVLILYCHSSSGLET